MMTHMSNKNFYLISLLFIFVNYFFLSLFEVDKQIYIMVSIVELLPSLPLEIRDEIFQYLSYKEHWTLAAVCKSWRILILNWQPLWDCLPVNERCPIFPDLLPYSSFIWVDLSNEYLWIRNVSNMYPI